MCKTQWLDIGKLTHHQKFSDFRLLLLTEQKLADLNTEVVGQQGQEAGQYDQVPGHTVEGVSSTLEENVATNNASTMFIKIFSSHM